MNKIKKLAKKQLVIKSGKRHLSKEDEQRQAVYPHQAEGAQHIHPQPTVAPHGRSAAPGKIRRILANLRRLMGSRFGANRTQK